MLLKPQELKTTLESNPQIAAQELMEQFEEFTTRYFDKEQPSSIQIEKMTKDLNNKLLFLDLRQLRRARELCSHILFLGFTNPKNQKAFEPLIKTLNQQIEFLKTIPNITQNCSDQISLSIYPYLNHDQNQGVPHLSY